MTEILLGKIYNKYIDNTDVILKIIKNPNTTEILLNEIYDKYNKDISIVLEIVKKPNITENLLKIISKNKYLEIRLKVVEHKYSDNELKAILNNEVKILEIMNSENKTIIEILSEYKEFSDNFAQKLIDEEDTEIIKAIIKNPNIIEKSLNKIYDRYDNDRNIVIEIIKNPNTTENLLDKIYDEWKYNEKIVVEIIKNPNTIENLLSKIYDKYNYNYNKDIILEFLKNPNTTKYLLDQIYNKYYKDKDIVLKFVKHPKTTEQLLNQIYNEYYYYKDIVIEIFKNPNITENLLKIISQSKYLETRLKVAEHQKLNDELKNILKDEILILEIMNSKNINHIQILSEYKDFSDNFIQKLIEEGSIEIIKAILNNLNISGVLLNLIYNEYYKNKDIVIKIIENPKTTKSLLNTIYDEYKYDEYITFKIINNMNTSEKLLNRIYNFIYHYKRKQNIIAEICNHTNITENLLKEISKKYSSNETIEEAKAKLNIQNNSELRKEVSIIPENIPQIIENENNEENQEILNQPIENVEIIDENSDIAEIVPQIITEFIPNNVELSKKNQSIIENTITEEIKTNEIITDEIKPETAIPKTVEIIEIPNESQKDEQTLKAVKKDDSVKNKKEKEISNKLKLNELNDENEYNLEKAELESDNNISYKYYEKYKRDPKVKEQAKERANGVCECCGEKGFEMMNGEYYLEVHHIEYLSENGRDNINNVCAVCATCHKKLHFSIDKEDLKAKIKEKIKNR